MPIFAKHLKHHFDDSKWSVSVNSAYRLLHISFEVAPDETVDVLGGQTLQNVC